MTPTPATRRLDPDPQQVPAAGDPEQLAATLALARAATWELDLADGSVSCSDGFHALLGMTPAEGRVAHRYWHDRAHPDDLLRVGKVLQDFQRHPDGEFDQNYRLQHADGSWRCFFVRGRLVAPAAGGRRLLSGLALDVTERHEVVDELRRTEQRYRRAIAAIRGCVYEVDLATDRLTIHGLDKLIGSENQPEPMDSLDRWSNRVHPQDLARLHRAIFENRALGRDYELKYRVFHSDGRVLHVWHRCTYFTDMHGRAQSAFGFIEDITEDVQLRDELQKTEAALRESQQLLSMISEFSPVHLSLFNLEGRCLFANRALEGSRLEDVVGHRLEDMLPAPLVEESLRHFQQVVETGGDADVTLLMSLGDSGPRHYRTLLSPVWREGKVIGVVANVDDVTESRLQQQQQELQASIIGRMQEGVMLLDREAKILFTNPALEAMFGYGPGELDGQNAAVLSVRSKQGIEDVKKMILDSVDAGQSPAVNFEGRLRDGGRSSFQAIYSGACIGEQQCVIAVVSDMTEQKRLQRELLQVETRVQHRIGSDLHDGVGQQLAGIAMMLRSLVQRKDNGDGRPMRKELQEAVDLVNAVLRATRSMARGLAPVRADRDGLLEGFEELAQHVRDRYGVPVRLDLSLPADLHFDENTASNLYRIAQEGLLNAARHSRANVIQLQLGTDGQRAELAIIDDGQGFDPYRVGRGGMGLRVMRFRAQMLGGYLIVESVAGSGTTLRCRCPLRPEREAA